MFHWTYLMKRCGLFLFAFLEFLYIALKSVHACILSVISIRPYSFVMFAYIINFPLNTVWPSFISLTPWVPFWLEDFPPPGLFDNWVRWLPLNNLGHGCLVQVLLRLSLKGRVTTLRSERVLSRKDKGGQATSQTDRGAQPLKRNIRKDWIHPTAPVVPDWIGECWTFNNHAHLIVGPRNHMWRKEGTTSNS